MFNTIKNNKKKTAKHNSKLNLIKSKLNNPTKAKKTRVPIKDRFKDKIDSLNTKFENWTANFDKRKNTQKNSFYKSGGENDLVITTPSKPLEKKQPFYQQLNTDLNKNINSSFVKRPGVVKKQEESFKVSEKKTNLPFSQTIKITATATNRTRYKKDNKKLK